MFMFTFYYDVYLLCVSNSKWVYIVPLPRHFMLWYKIILFNCYCCKWADRCFIRPVCVCESGFGTYKTPLYLSFNALFSSVYSIFNIITITIANEMMAVDYLDNDDDDDDNE